MLKIMIFCHCFYFKKIYMKLFNVFCLAKENYNFAFFIEYLNFAAIFVSPCPASKKKSIPCTQLSMALDCINMSVIYAHIYAINGP